MQKTGRRLRLPTEAEWEYACRAGTTTEYNFGDAAETMIQYGWCQLNSSQQTHPVGQKEPNRWGLYDMHGNVWEWCEDWYGSYPSNTPSGIEDPHGPPNGVNRVLRGGSFYELPILMRASHRYWHSPAAWSKTTGFRLVMETE